MDFQKLVDTFQMAAAVLSVEKKPDDQWGEIRILRTNDIYKKITGPGYRDGIRYDEIIPKERKFEDFCYRCAVKKMHLHAYVDTKSMGVWTDGTYIPLDGGNDKVDYCLFLLEFTSKPEADRMSDISIQTAPLVIQTCIKLRGNGNFYECMNTVIADIQQITDSFCSCIIVIDKKKKRSAFLCSKFRNDEASIDDFADNLPYELIDSWDDTIRNNSIIIKDDFDMNELEKRNAPWVKSLRAANVKSLILVPLSHGQKNSGYLFITNFNTEKLVEIKEFVELSSYFISAEIENNNLMEQLEYMSNVDFLTGINNRNAMNARVDFFNSGIRTVKAPFGILFADLNGLKQCNDNYGHEEGDKLLKDAAAILKEVFDGYEIYRAGGDEFVVIAPGCPEDIFEQKASELRKRTSGDCNVSFAIGTHWSEDGRDIRKSMHLADEAMYADKKAYYESHTDKKRRI